MIEYHQEIPKNLADNVAWRKAICAEAAGSATKRREIIERCTADILYYVNGFVWQYNPELLGNQIGPFITYPFQDRAITKIVWCVQEQRDMVIEKSKKMGLSWMCLFSMDWFYLFHPYSQSLMISKGAEAVDSKSPNSLFWKIDFMHDHLPVWMQPKGPKGREREDRVSMFFGNRNGATMSGEATTGRAGVGGRGSQIFIDEAGIIDEMRNIWTRTSDTAPCRIVNSTHYDINNCFAELCRVDDGSIEKLRCHWSEHPKYAEGLYQATGGKLVEYLDKTYSFPADYPFIKDGKVRSPWYDRQCARKRDSRAIAMDLDIDPQGSMSQVFNAVAIKALEKRCSFPWWQGDVVYDKETAQPQGLTLRVDGPLKLWCHLPHDNGPIPGIYTIGADVASGHGASPSCLSIVNGSTGEKVGEYFNSRIFANDLAFVLAALGWMFRSEEGTPAKVIWEKHGPGVTMGIRLLELGYQNFYSHEDDTVAYRKNPTVDKPGFTMSGISKRNLIEQYRDALEGGRFLNRSKDAVADCLNFRYNSAGNVEHPGEVLTKGGDPSGAKINHGDLVIADALAWKLAKPTVGKREKELKERVPFLSLAWRRRYHEEREDEDESA